MNACSLCRHYRRKQTGPHLWDSRCDIQQAAFPDAQDCIFYQPPAQPDMGRESSGMGYVWDSEFEGQP